MIAKFGTDGIRGIYGETLTEETAFALGRALGEKGNLLIGRDNRPSSPSLARAVACGAASAGAEFLSVGLTTTPAIYHVLTRLPYTNAVMVTASHNPPSHNGLKVFTRNGKPNEKERTEIEKTLRDTTRTHFRDIKYAEDPSPLSLYEDRFREFFRDLSGLTVVLDLAGGAGYRFKGLLGTLGAKVIPLNARESGDRINESCGALHPEECLEETIKRGADLGIALDGDGDRIIAATRDGRLLDGDDIVYLLALRMQRKGALKKSKVAMTVMTNGGVVKSLERQEITVRTTPVGDSAVAAAMAEEGLNLGGEQSGHVILSDYLPTGDGLLTGAALLASIRDDGPLALEPPPMRYPQIKCNLPTAAPSLLERPELLREVKEIEQTLTNGRILLRASGTEAMIRILVECPNETQAKAAMRRLVERLER
ncbi:MAG: hypothetical protein IJT69_00410 [Clostridia bacterium]|nr:hypothetical protein [Clostridia bacterium]